MLQTVKMNTQLEIRLGALLIGRGWTLCAAESCTGGLALHRLTNVAGSSAYVLGGVVAYANEIKHRLLGVSDTSLATYGAVSEQVAREMALGARRLFGADIAISITGIAGPSGGTPEKPVGLTYVGLAGPADVLLVRRYQWHSDREGNKAASVEAAFSLILEVWG
jgi:PncC family amidohydrolase